MKNKPMKTVKGWAYVDKATGKAKQVVRIGRTRKSAEEYRNEGERIARVVITEVARAPKGN